MELDRLNEFVIIAQEKSIKKAGAKLSLSPATLSARLASFEASLGTTLFLRQHSGLVLTESGNRLYSNATAITNRYQTLKDELQLLNQEEYHTLRIAVLGSGLPFYLGPYLDILSKKFPELHLDILDDSSYSIKEGLLSNNIDLYFAPAISHFLPEGIARLHFVVPHQYIVMPTNHRLAQQTSISLKNLDGETFILYPRTKETCVRDFQLENLKAAGIRFHTYESETASVFYQLLVPIGKGILLTPIHTMSGLPNSISLPVNDITYPAPATLFYKRNNPKPEVTNFVSGFSKFVKGNAMHDNRKTL